MTPQHARRIDARSLSRRAFARFAHAACVALCALMVGRSAATTENYRTPTGGEVEPSRSLDDGERDLQSSPLLVRDPALNAYMRGVACKIAPDECASLRVYIVEQPLFNAMMSPNGMLIVCTGALLRLRNEAELAFVLGHEAGHFRAHHIAPSQHDANESAWSRVFGSSGAASRFSREQEREADRMGFAAMVARGYDPQSAAELQARMLREEDARADEKSSSPFRHPPTRERLDDLRGEIAALGAHGDEHDTAGYRAAVRPFLQRWLDAELARRHNSASILVVSELLADAPPEDKALLSFYLGEAYRRRGNPSDRNEAARRYAQAIALPNPPAAAWREHGLALRDAGQRREAADALRRYLELAGDAPDRAFVEHDLAELQEHAP